MQKAFSLGFFFSLYGRSVFIFSLVQELQISRNTNNNGNDKTINKLLNKTNILNKTNKYTK